jgi:hypothetical protein
MIFPELTKETKFTLTCWFTALVYLGLCGVAVLIPFSKDKG